MDPHERLDCRGGNRTGALWADGPLCPVKYRFAGIIAIDNHYPWLYNKDGCYVRDLPDLHIIREMKLFRVKSDYV